MVVVRFRVQCTPGTGDEAAAAFAEVVAQSRPLDGVVHFDVGRDVTNPDGFIATEVFDDRAALERQEDLPVVAETLGLLERLLVAEPEATIFEVASFEPWG